MLIEEERIDGDSISYKKIEDESPTGIGKKRDPSSTNEFFE